MNIDIITMYPEIFDGFAKNPIISRAINSGLVNIKYIDIKEHTKGSFRSLDDTPYGGGKGMILRVDAVCNALNSVHKENSHVVLMSPKGRVFNQEEARRLSSYSDLVFVCGHYEGYDARIENYADEMISIGDFILSGGENAAAVVCDSIIRLLPGVLKDGVSEDESFETGLLEYKQYTHPAEYEGACVPNVLMSGNKDAIEKYKKASSLIETAKYRKDLLYKCVSDRDSIGRSSAEILFFDDLVMKIGEDLDREVEALNWMNGKVSVPCIRGYEDPYLVMDKISGKMLCDAYYMTNPMLLMMTAAKALKELWKVDISSCPLDSSAEAKLEIAKHNIENGLVDFDKSQGFDTQEELLQWLIDHKPEMDPVFSHGDFCLPNIIVGKKGKCSYIDVGLAGVGDRFCDIALCIRSIRMNLKMVGSSFEFNEDKFFELLEIKPNHDKIRWYTLLDELF